jgi:hypothetical protein
MKALCPLLAVAAFLAGCATNRHFSETTLLPQHAYKQLTDDALPYIATAFPASESRMVFTGRYTNLQLAPLLDGELRKKGYYVAQIKPPRFWFLYPLSPSRSGRGGGWQPRPDDSEYGQGLSLCAEDPLHTFQVSYTVDLEGPGFYYFSLSLGKDWQFTRLYRLTAEGTLLPYSAPALKNN